MQFSKTRMSCLQYYVLLLLSLRLPMDQTCSMIVVPLVPSYGTCPGEVNILQQLKRSISDTLNEILSGCGDGLWHRVAYLNMSDPSQQCPPAWREYNTSGIRACGRPVSSSGISYPATLYPTNKQYSRVCGRVIGYQVGTPDGFY